MVIEQLRRSLELIDELESQLKNLDNYTYQAHFAEEIRHLRSATTKQLKRREEQELSRFGFQTQQTEVQPGLDL